VDDGVGTETFGSLLRRRRLAARLTQGRLAERCGIGKRTLQALERDAARPRRETVRRLSAALGLPPGDEQQFEAATSAPRQRPAAEGTGPLGATARTSTRSHGSRRGPSAETSSALRSAPTWLTSFVGRARELREIADLLTQARLVTLTGPGGCGKSRLAVEAAARAVAASGGTAVFVGLASIAEPSHVLPAVANALGVREIPGETLARRLEHAICNRDLLLVIDNVEHLLSAAPEIAALLHACLRLRVLATSRELLRLSGEQVYLVPPLSLPTAATSTDDVHLPPTTLEESEAVRLFADRARGVLPDFRLDRQSAPVVAEICWRLDGLPLAIELAAARLRHLPLVALPERLGTRLPLLTDGPRDAPARQRTLHDAIAWSYTLLDASQQQLFLRLAVFAGGFTIPAAQAVCFPDSRRPVEALDGVSSLVDKSLLVRVDSTSGEARFSMLETLREYALERLEASGEGAAIRRQHAAWYLALAESAEAGLHGPAQAAWLSRLEREHDNLRTALTWSLSADGELASGVRLASALFRFWWRRGYLTEGRAWLGRVIANDAQVSAPLRARVRNAAGTLARAQGEYAAAWSWLQQSRAVYEMIGDRRGVAWTAVDGGLVMRVSGAYAQARALLEHGVELCRAVGDRRELAVALTVLGELARDEGDYARATALIEESLDLVQPSADPWLISNRLMHLGVLASRQGDQERAAGLLGQALAMKQALADPGDVAWVRTLQGMVERKRGRPDRARTCCIESLPVFVQLGMPWGVVECLELLAALGPWDGGPDRAGRLFGAAAAVRARIGFGRPPSERAEYDQAIAAARHRLTDGAFDRAWAEGQALSLEQAVRFALDEP
jgi:non-specific serine/threonine protein kinase